MDNLCMESTKETCRCSSVKRNTGFKAALLSITAIALALRLYDLGTESLWIDEGYSIRDANPEMSLARASKPLYYWILSFWIKLGESDWFLRLPAVIFGVMAVVLVFLIGTRIWNQKAGMLAGLMAAVSPMQIDHSQEIRMYSLLTMLVLASVYFLLEGLKTKRTLHLVSSAVTLWLAILTHPLACLMLLPYGLLVIEDCRRNKTPVLRYLALFVLVLLAWAPWIPRVLGFGSGFENSWAAVETKPSISQIPMLWGFFGIGDWDPAAAGSNSRLMLFGYTYGNILLMALFAWLDRRRSETRFVASWLVLPITALFLLSVVKTNAWMTRYLIFTSPAFFLLSGAMWARQRSKAVFALIGILVFILPVSKTVRYYQKITRPEWRPAVHYVMQHQQPTDLIGIYRSGNRFVFDHYYKGQAKWITLGPENFPKEQLVGWNEQKATQLINSFPQAPRRWLFVAMMPLSAEDAIRRVLYKDHHVLYFHRYNGVRLYLFESKHK